jgi:hypothetical protein
MGAMDWMKGMGIVLNKYLRSKNIFFCILCCLFKIECRAIPTKNKILIFFAIKTIDNQKIYKYS